MSQRVFWGHGLQDYMEMFDLNQEALGAHILEYGCGPSAFNADMKNKHKTCVSLDPLFALDYATLKVKTGLIFESMLEEVKPHTNLYDFSQEGGFSGFIEQRKAGMAQFFNDYNQGKKQHRYRSIQAIELPFKDFHFDLALTSHYLFSGIDGQDETFHAAVIQELARVAKEVRIFPLIDGYGKPSPFLGPVLLTLQQQNLGTELRSVPYHLQKEGNAMLRVWAQSCRV